MKKAILILKHNIDAMLKARGQTRHDLAFYCRRTDAWLSKIFSEPKPGKMARTERGIPLKYLDRMSDFFGVATYQLFQPGISHLTERRTEPDRRSASDRRISATLRGLPSTTIRQIVVTPEDEAILATLHDLTYEKYQKVKEWITVAQLSTGTGRNTKPHGEPPPGETLPPTSMPPPTAPQKHRKKPAPKKK